MAKGLTLQEFIDRSNEIHSNMYDYSNVEYINTLTPVRIYCTIHDIEFTQLPKVHLRGNTGCSKCKNVRRKQTTIEKYGVSNISQLEEIKEKKRETCFEHFGVDHSLQSPEVREKGKRTNLTNLGVAYPAQSKIVQEKIINTNLDRYGTTCPFQNDEVKEKIKHTNLERLGVEYPMQSKDVRVKSKQTCLKKYGVEQIAHSKTIQEKIKQTNLDRYGVECTLQSKDVREKIKQTNLERYGVENPTQSKEIQEKIKQTNLDRYGFETPLQSKTIQEKIKQTNLDRYGVIYNSQRHISNDSLDKLNNILYLIEQHHVEKKTLTQIAYELNVTPKTVADKFKQFDIKIKRFARSQMEKDIIELIERHSPYEIITNSQDIISNEIDIFLPEINFAIEVNGDFYHSELRGKDKHYHLDKLLECENINIDLMHAWEHDWIHSQEIMASIILAKINKTLNKLNARQCKVCEISSNIARNFLNNNHLHGYVNSSINIGLYYDNELVSVMTFMLNRFGCSAQYEMSRFASKINTNVRGAASKLFKCFIKIHKPKSVVSYAHRGLFTGTVYRQLGFKFSHVSQPSYRYFHKSNTSRLFSRLKFQKHKLEKQLENYDPTVTAWKNMVNNGYDRIWDCGNNVYLWNGDK